MKWIFFVLVILNLVIFSGMVAKNFVLKSNPVVVEETKHTPAFVNEEFYLKNGSTQSIDTASEVEITDDRKSLDKELTYKLIENRKNNKKDDRLDKKETSNTRNLSTTHSCAAKITLNEDVYLRIRGLLNEWQHIANREIVKNPKAGKKSYTTGEYQVLIDGGENKADILFSLISQGFKPIELGQTLLLGKFKSQSEANTLNKRLKKGGFASHINTVTAENTKEEPLSTAVYQVTFLKINPQDETRLANILKPYGSLVKSSCK